MSYMLVSGAVFHRIENGLVYWEVVSGDDRFPKAMPISEFRDILEEGRRVMAEWDAAQLSRVIPFPSAKAKQRHRARPPLHPE